MMKNYIVFILVFVCQLSFGQSSKLNKADEYYTKLSYIYSAKTYEQLIGSEDDSPKLKSKLAYSYYRLGEMEKSEAIYRQMILTEDATADDFYNYAQVLKQNGKYEESDEWMKRFHRRESSDFRGQLFDENKNYKMLLDKQDPMFEVKSVDFNSTTSDFGGYLTNDNKYIYLISSRKRGEVVERDWMWNNRNFLDIYRSEINDDYTVSKLKKVKKISTKLHEGPLCFSPDGKKVYYTRNNEEKGKIKGRDESGVRNLKIYVANVSSEWNFENETVLPFCSKDYSVGHPTVSKDGKVLYFSSDMPGSIGGADIWKVTINEDGSYGTPINLGKGINTEGDEMFPWLNFEGTLFFSSNGLLGYGGLDVFAVIIGEQGTSKPINIGKPINSRFDDFAFVMNNGSQKGFFSSNRTGGKGEDDIYFFKQIRPIKNPNSLNGGVKDLLTGEDLDDVKVLVANKDGKVIDSIYLDQSTFDFTLPEGEDEVQLITNKKGYVSDVQTIKIDPDKTKQEVEIALLPVLQYHFLGEVRDKKTDQQLNGVEVTLTDETTSKVFESVKTNNKGGFTSSTIPYKYADSISYTFNLAKEGYVSKTISLAEVLARNEEIKVGDKLLSMVKIEIGKTDLNDVVNINPIYFDLNSSFIRPDAAMELDKVVKVMNENPGMIIELGSHTDSRSTDKYNMWLSDRRAKSSANYIISKGIDKNRITGKGYGESRLKISDAEINKAQSEEEKELLHQKNRRTEFIIVKMK